MEHAILWFEREPTKLTLHLWMALVVFMHHITSSFALYIIAMYKIVIPVHTSSAFLAKVVKVSLLQKVIDFLPTVMVEEVLFRLIPIVAILLFMESRRINNIIDNQGYGYHAKYEHTKRSTFLVLMLLIAIVSAYFGYLHGGYAYISMQGVGGLIYSLLFLKAGAINGSFAKSLYAVITVHLVFNIISVSI